MSKVKDTAYRRLRGRCRPRIVTGCNYRWVVRLRGRITWRRWHLTLSSSFASNYVYRSNILLSLTQIPLTVFLQSLFIMYRNGPPSCTKVVQADSACSLCTETGWMYRSRPPPCPEVVMYRTGHNLIISVRVYLCGLLPLYSLDWIGLEWIGLKTGSVQCSSLSQNAPMLKVWWN